MISAREIELEAKVVALERQLVAMDAALAGEGLALARRYEAALREVLGFRAYGIREDSATVGRIQNGVKMALAAEKSVMPAKRCQCPTCVLHRGHKGFHNDGLREWGKRPHQKKRPIRVDVLP